MIKTEHFAQHEFTSPEELRAWLRENHGQSDSIWAVTYKKSAGDRYLSTGQILDELLCFGWIDGIRRKLDDQRTMQLISPRQAQHWSKTYKDRAARLEREGWIKGPGRYPERRSRIRCLRSGHPALRPSLDQAGQNR